MATTTAHTHTLDLPRSAPGYLTTLFSTLIIGQQALALYDPSSAMQQLGIKDEASARFIAFALILINCYDFLGALQDDWAIYYFSFFSRFAAAALFQYLGGGWMALVPLELGSAVVLGGCMIYTSQRDRSKGKHD